MGLFEDIGKNLGALAAPIPLLGTALSFGSSIFNAKEQSRVNDRMEANSWDMFNTARADQNTAHQREVADLKAAGLNPILSANKGAGVSSGTSPSLTAPQIQGPEILPALQFMEQVKNNKADRALKYAQANQIAQTVDIKTPLEMGADAFKGYTNFFRDWWNDDEKPNHGTINRGPIKKNPNKKTEQFQRFWNQRDIPFNKK